MKKRIGAGVRELFFLGLYVVHVLRCFSLSKLAFLLFLHIVRIINPSYLETGE
jgi:hypothetical protein